MVGENNFSLFISYIILMKFFSLKTVFIVILFCGLVLFCWKFFLSKYFVDTIYEDPVHSSQSVYEEIESGPEWSHSWEVSRRYDIEEQIWFAKIQGFSHMYRFQKFGIFLQLQDPYDFLFFEKEPENPFIYSMYSWSYTIRKQWSSFVVQKFEKNKKSEFIIDLLEKYHRFTWCLFEKFVYQDWFSPLLKSIASYQTYHLFSLDWSACDMFGNTSVFFVYIPKHPNYYYKLSWQDACAPTCWIPYSFEIL